MRLLRCYDAIGLLKPMHIDEESGYRYYSTRQLPRLESILVGLTLDQFQRIVKSIEKQPF